MDAVKHTYSMVEMFDKPIVQSMSTDEDDRLTFSEKACSQSEYKAKEIEMQANSYDPRSISLKSKRSSKILKGSCQL